MNIKKAIIMKIVLQIFRKVTVLESDLANLLRHTTKMGKLQENLFIITESRIDYFFTN